MKISRTFSISLNGTSVAIEAEISFTAYEILNARCPAGLPFDVSLDHLETFEAYVESRITSTTLQALDLDTYAPASFVLHAYGNDVLAIVHEAGHVVERNSATWSEVVESWFIDREYTEAIESDAPRAAAAAGFLRPVPIPSPQRTGFGLRRAA